jgi:hypothetical protein
LVFHRRHIGIGNSNHPFFLSGAISPNPRAVKRNAVSRERKRLRDRIESDKHLKKRLIEIEVSLLS